MDEIIYIDGNALKKVTEHALKFYNELNQKFSMVMGLLGGRIVEDNLCIYDSDAIAEGNEYHVEMFEDHRDRNILFDDYLKIKPSDNLAEYTRYYRDLKKKGMFIMGYYVSFPLYSNFFIEDNMETQFSYQYQYNRAFCMIIYPEKISSGNLEEYIVVYRLKNLRRDASRDNWVRLKLQLIVEGEGFFL